MSSILDVANEAKVATSTVSRVINGTAQISAETQQRVQDAVRKLGYMPRSKQTRQTNNRMWHLGVVYSPRMLVDGVMAKACRDWLIGIKEMTSEAGGHLEIYPGSTDVTKDTMYRHSLDNDELHGVIFIGAVLQYGYVQDAIARKLPVVLVSDRSAHGNMSSVYADLYNAGKLAMEHLLSLGHTRIAIGHLPQGMMHVADLRRQGAMDALAAHGLTPVIDKRADPAYDDLAYFKQSASDMIKAGVTGLFSSDYAAVRYIDAFAKEGLHVPRDISVVGCDHTGIKPASGLSLTSIAYDRIAMGRLAVSNLMQIIRQGEQVQSIEACVPTRLVVNQTTAKLGQSSAAAGASKRGK